MRDDIRRITPDEVLDAYRTTGWKPDTEHFYVMDDNGISSGCAIGAVMEAQFHGCTGDPILVGPIKDRFWEVVPGGYRFAFHKGFRGLPAREEDLRCSEWFRWGYADGIACHRAVFEETSELPAASRKDGK